MNTETEISPYIRRAWYDTLAAGGYIKKRVIFDYELLYVKDGNCVIEIEDRRYTPQKGDLFLFRPKIPHQITVSSDTPLIQPHIHFDLTRTPESEEIPINFTPYEQVPAEQKKWFRPDVLEEWLSPIPDFIHVNDIGMVEQMLVDIIYVHAHKATFLDGLKEQSSFIQLLHYVLYEMMLSTHRKPCAQKNDTALRVKMFLDHNSHRNLSLDEVAKNCYVSKCYMITAFKAVYGLSPYQYHQRQRIKESKYMLKFTNFTITQIAESMGFGGIHAYSAIFRQFEGQSPTEYRQSVGMG